LPRAQGSTRGSAFSVTACDFPMRGYHSRGSEVADSVITKFQIFSILNFSGFGAIAIPNWVVHLVYMRITNQIIKPRPFTLFYVQSHPPIISLLLFLLLIVVLNVHTARCRRVAYLVARSTQPSIVRSYFGSITFWSRTFTFVGVSPFVYF
jgi:hypothetical protein